MAGVKTNLYNAAADVGRIHLGFSIIICVVLAIIFFVIAYYNNKNWNYNLIDIQGTVEKINTPSGQCDSYTTQNNNQTTTTYNCPVTVRYQINNAPSSTVDLHTSGFTNYSVNSSIALSYDTASNAKPTLQIFRINSLVFVGIGIFLMIFAYIDYLMAKNKTLSAITGAYDVARIVL